jgi:hypothetical protein
LAPGARRSFVLALLVLACGVAPAAARAQEGAGRARLVYVVDPAAQPCPTTDEIRAAIEARVGHAVFGEPATVTVEVSVRREANTFVATVALPDAPGERGAKRELRSDAGCAELATAAALVASIAVDPASALRPPVEVVTPPPPPPASRTWRAFVGLGPRAAWGLTPDPTGGLALSGAAVTERAALGAALEGFASSDAAFGAGSVGIRPMGLALLPCRLGGHWEACGVARLGLLRGGGEGFAQDLAAWRAFFGVGARGAAFVDLGRVRLRASLEATAILPRTAFIVGDATVYTTRGVSFAAGLDALFAFQ